MFRRIFEGERENGVCELAYLRLWRLASSVDWPEALHKEKSTAGKSRVAVFVLQSGGIC